MNLLDATTIVIDCIREQNCYDNDNIVRAVNRLEKRLDVLKLRRAKRHKNNRWKAFRQAMEIFGGGAYGEPLQACVICQKCKEPIGFEDFCHTAIFNGNGKIKTLQCLNCGVTMSNSPESKLYLSPECTSGQLSETPQSHASPATPQPAARSAKAQTGGRDSRDTSRPA